MALTIELATSSKEKEAIFSQRYGVYCAEMQMLSDIADHDRRLLIEPSDQSARLFYGKKDGELIGSYRAQYGADAPFSDVEHKMYQLDLFQDFVPTQKMAIGSRFTIDKAYRAGSASYRFVERFYETAIQEGVALLFLETVPHLVNLYANLGWRRFGNTKSSDHYGISVTMVLVTEDVKYLRSQKSPLAKVAERFDLENKTPNWVQPLMQSLEHQDDDGDRRNALWHETFAVLHDPRWQKQNVFAGMHDEDISHFLEASQVISCQKGEALIKEGTMYKSLLIIMKGTVLVKKSDQAVATLTQGDIIGEMSFLLDQSRSMNIEAFSEEVSALHLSANAIERITTNNPKTGTIFYRNLARILALRLLSTNQQIG